MIIPGWTKNYIVSAHDAKVARDVILANLRENFSADGGATTFKSIPFTRMIYILRDRVGRMPGRWVDQQDLIEALGFKVIKARSEISYRPGQYRAECHCIVQRENWDISKLDEFSIEEATFVMAQATKAIRRISQASHNRRHKAPAIRLRRGVGSY